MSISTTTKLEAVNAILGSIGETPVNTIGDELDESAIAASTIDEVSRAVQSRGWSWNTEEGFSLQLDAEGKAPLPYNVLHVDTQSPRLVARGQYIYDKYEHTYKHSRPPKVSLIIGLEWEELPEAARAYIMYRAGRVFQARQVGSQALFEFTRADEYAAKVALEDAELASANITIFDNPELGLMLDRSSSRPATDYPAGSI